MRRLFAPLALILLVVAGCAGNQGSPIRQTWELEMEYVRVATPVASYVESTTAEPAVKATLQQLSSMAYESIQRAKVLAQGGAGDDIVDDAIDQAERAVKEFKRYAVDQLMGATR